LIHTQTIVGCQYLDPGRLFALESVATNGIHEAYYADIGFSERLVCR